MKKIKNLELIINDKKLLQDIKRKTPVSTGNLRNSLKIEIVDKPGNVSIDLWSLDYFKYVDKGRKPGKMPPMKSLTGWVSKHFNVSYKKLNSLTFLIARKIGKKGIKGRNILKDIKLNNYIKDWKINL